MHDTESSASALCCSRYCHFGRVCCKYVDAHAVSHPWSDSMVRKISAVQRDYGLCSLRAHVLFISIISSNKHASWTLSLYKYIICMLLQIDIEGEGLVPRVRLFALLCWTIDAESVGLLARASWVCVLVWHIFVNIHYWWSLATSKAKPQATLKAVCKAQQSPLRREVLLWLCGDKYLQSCVECT